MFCEGKRAGPSEPQSASLPLHVQSRTFVSGPARPAATGRREFNLRLQTAIQQGGGARSYKSGVQRFRVHICLWKQRRDEILCVTASLLSSLFLLFPSEPNECSRSTLHLHRDGAARSGSVGTTPQNGVGSVRPMRTLWSISLLLVVILK